MKTLQPCQLYGLTIPAGSACRALSPAEKLALVFERGPSVFNVASALLASEALEFDGGRKVFVTRETAEGWPELDPSLAEHGRALTMLCERAMRTFRERTRRQRMSDREGERVAILKCRRQNGDVVMVCVRECEAVAVVGAERRSGRSRAWPVVGDPAVAIRAAVAWLELGRTEAGDGGEDGA